MNFLKYVGVTNEGVDADRVIDTQIGRILAVGRRAHTRLRESLRDDPKFGSVICKAMGCQEDGCGQPLPALAERVNQIPGVIEKISPSA